MNIITILAMFVATQLNSSSVIEILYIKRCENTTHIYFKNDIFENDRLLIKLANLTNKLEINIKLHRLNESISLNSGRVKKENTSNKELSISCEHDLLKSELEIIARMFLNVNMFLYQTSTVKIYEKIPTKNCGCCYDDSPFTLPKVINEEIQEGYKML